MTHEVVQVPSEEFARIETGAKSCYDPRVMSGYELEFVEWLRNRQRARPAVELGIGDDMAIVDCGLRIADSPGGPGEQSAIHNRQSAIRKRLCVSSDMLLDGVHFDTRCHGLALIGRKAIACGLSDCAAMAVSPLAATVSLALPADFSIEDAKELFGGMFAMADEFGLTIAGGDTTQWEHPLAIDVAILATPHEGIEPVRRSGARPGDTLFVTGPLGGSLLGRHLTFTPRVREARELAQGLGGQLHAMIDISDGLALDLWRICLASHVGAILEERQVGQVVSEDARLAAAADGRSPLEHALGDGEDYELLLAVSPGVWDGCSVRDRLSSRSRSPDRLESRSHRPEACPTGSKTGPNGPLHPVGRVAESGLRMVRGDGTTEPLEPKGYVH